MWSRKMLSVKHPYNVSLSWVATDANLYVLGSDLWVYIRRVAIFYIMSYKKMGATTFKHDEHREAKARRKMSKAKFITFEGIECGKSTQVKFL